jgi:hypothetical protein
MMRTKKKRKRRRRNLKRKRKITPQFKLHQLLKSLLSKVVETLRQPRASNLLQVI